MAKKYQEPDWSTPEPTKRKKNVIKGEGKIHQKSISRVEKPHGPAKHIQFQLSWGR